VSSRRVKKTVNPMYQAPDSPAAGKALPLPHERDESPKSMPSPESDVIQQAARDLKRGLVDTDMRATPGLDAQRRENLTEPPSVPKK
jgi:hypothetical protein